MKKKKKKRLLMSGNKKNQLMWELFNNQRNKVKREQKQIGKTFQKINQSQKEIVQEKMKIEIPVIFKATNSLHFISHNNIIPQAFLLKTTLFPPNKTNNNISTQTTYDLFN